ncbi:glutamyl-tRNA reductase [Rubrobacter marinus]|uniref:Glutamyl-tRNA reductase n=1 Tax=Rubrobacter marinus TaxID=2653852 RepID=A0A6G8PVL9_9ACTN|nr:glutamyl-tRNA reductase [Rubrobacter marinus]QIN78261.1 glutamyl-tRNA reductase [Rubrobacter marinus]
MLIAVAGMSHRSAPIEVRERVAFAPCAARPFLRRLKDEGTVAEAVLVSTCNRTELYAVVEGPSEEARGKLLRAMADEKGLHPELLESHTYWYTEGEAVGHLYRVASSLDSMVVGESQILGQVREAYRTATEELCAGPILNRLFHTSLRVGKGVRSETGIGDSSLSVPHVAVKLAEEVFGTLRGRSAMVVGAGEMSELVVRHLASRGIGEVKIANRTASRAEELAARLGGAAVGFDDLAEELPGVDVVVSSTGAGEWVVGSETVAAALRRREEPLFFIDIAVPRDIDPVVQNLDRAYVYDVDDLQAVVDRNTDDRGAAAEAAEAMIAPAVLEYMSWLSTLHVAPLIKELRDGAERIRRHEVARTLKGMDLSEAEAEAVERMSHALVNKLLHGPIQEIKALAERGSPVEGAEVRRRLLELEGLGLGLYRAGGGTGAP